MRARSAPARTISAEARPAEQQPQSVDDNRLAAACFAREQVQPGEAHADALDDSVVSTTNSTSIV